VLADARADLFRYQGIGPLAKWVDDHIFFQVRLDFLESYNLHHQARHMELSIRGQVHDGGRLWYGGRIFPDGTLNEHVEDNLFLCLDLSSHSPRSIKDSQYTYNFDDIDRLSSTLGIPWERSKDLPFASSTSYIGFLWDSESRTVSLSPKKRLKYSLSIDKWLLCPKHSLNDVQKLYGRLLHVCLVVPAGRAYITGLEAMLELGNARPFALYPPVKTVAEELSWWSTKLVFSLSRPIPAPLILLDLHAFSDASSGFGIAIHIQGRWRAWRLIPGWQSLNGSRDIGWAEAVGFELLIRAISRLEALANTLRYTAITKDSSKAGGILGAKTDLLTRSSAESIPSSNSLITQSPFIQLMFPVNPTLRTLLPEAFIPRQSSSYLRSSYQLISTGSLLTPRSPTLPLNSVSAEIVAILSPSLTALTTLSGLIVPTRLHSTPPFNSVPPSPTQSLSRFSSTLPLENPSFVRSPHKYLSHLTPVLSELCPHCPACDRLRLWKPTFLRSSDVLNLEITDSDLDRLITMINTSWLLNFESLTCYLILSRLD
jgi:hypothetical protein